MKLTTYILCIVLCIVGCRSQALPQTNAPISDATIINSTSNIVDSGSENVDVVVEKTPKHENILMLGDSQTGYLINQLPEVQTSNETVFYNYRPGTTLLYWNERTNRNSQHILNYIPTNVNLTEAGNFVYAIRNAPKVDTILIMLGTCVYNFKFLQSIDNILNEIKSIGMKCIWNGPTKVYGEHHTVNDLLKNKVEPVCKYIDVEKLDIPLLGDGTHPTIAGSKKWIKEIWKVKQGL